MESVAIGNRIQLLRKQLKLTQGAFAKQLGISQQHVSHVENGSKEPSEQLIKHLCLFFNTTQRWLLDGEGEMFISPSEAVRRHIAQFGDKAYYQAIKEMLDENGAVALAILTPRPGSDPDLDRMIGLLADIWQYGDEDLKTWARVQFARAFPPDVENDLLKKRAGEREQAASVG